MKFYTHRILSPAGKAQAFPDWVDSYFKKLAEASEEKKDSGCCSGAGEVTEKHKPAKSEDGTDAVLINNDPNYQKGESVDGKKEEKKTDKVETKKTSAKVAKKAKDEPKANINNNVQNNPKKPDVKGKKASVTKVFKTASQMNESEKVKMIIALASNKNNPIEYIEAMLGIKMANLSPKNKALVKNYFTILYGEKYANEMVQDS